MWHVSLRLWKFNNWLFNASLLVLTHCLKPRDPELLGPMFIRSLSLITVLTPDFPGVKRGVKTQFTLIQLPSDWDHTRYKMVCAKCQKSQKKTELATPGVKRKNDLYLGSPASNDKGKSSATSNASGVGKVGQAALHVLILSCSLVDMFDTE